MAPVGGGHSADAGGGTWRRSSPGRAIGRGTALVLALASEAILFFRDGVWRAIYRIVPWRRRCGVAWRWTMWRPTTVPWAMDLAASTSLRTFPDPSWRETSSLNTVSGDGPGGGISISPAGIPEPAGIPIGAAESSITGTVVLVKAMSHEMEGSSWDVRRPAPSGPKRCRVVT